MNDDKHTDSNQDRLILGVKKQFHSMYKLTPVSIINEFYYSLMIIIIYCKWNHYDVIHIIDNHIIYDILSLLHSGFLFVF